jgi:hypothetical protein
MYCRIEFMIVFFHVKYRRDVVDTFLFFLFALHMGATKGKQAMHLPLP